jgi:Nif-specific regulatory protein
MAAKLIALAGPQTSEASVLGDEFSLGRETDNTLSIEDHCLSRHHCVLKRRGPQITLHDLSSKNGTFVNDVPVVEHALRHRDEIRAGSSLFLFVCHDAGGEAAGEARFDGSVLSSGETILLPVEDAAYGSLPQALEAARSDEGRLRDLDLLLRIGHTLAETHPLEALQRRLLEWTLDAISADHAAVLMGLHAQSLEPLCSACWSRAGGWEAAVEIPQDLAARILQSRSGILANDLALCGELHEPVRSEVGSLLAVPLLCAGEAVGFIYLDRVRSAQRFTREHLELLTGIAGVVAPALDRALAVAQLEMDNRRLRDEMELRHNMIGRSAAMRGVLDFIARVAPSESTVLIRGETGTGKELVARAIHRSSPRARCPFMAINCAALTETLLESELFGHERGAFTGAVVRKKGKLEEAAGGSVFLDEVGELAASSQAKLLRVLQEREFERLGSTRPIHADIRVIAATNRDLEQAVAGGAFRPDLCYRLNVVSVTMPPLRDRKEDVPLLARYFVQKHARSMRRRIEGLSREAQACLMGYDWPGNIRELENAIERAVVLGSTDTILPEDLPEHILAVAPIEEAAASSFHEAVRQAKRQIVLESLEQAGGNYTEAARLLGLHPSNLHRLIRQLDLRSGLRRQ